MRLRIVAAGNRMPGWVDAGVEEYAGRMPRECPVQLVEIGLGKRGRGGDCARATEDEGRRMLGALREDEQVIALEVSGRSMSTEQLATRMQDWFNRGRDVAFLIGGPDGLARACRERAGFEWSLSTLTLPHGLARVVLAEQLYRAWSVLKGHPYHRA